MALIVRTEVENAIMLPAQIYSPLNQSFHVAQRWAPERIFTYSLVATLKGEKVIFRSTSEKNSFDPFKIKYRCRQTVYKIRGI
jgi:hypothetical protein